MQTTWLLNGFQMLILFLNWRMTAYLRCNIKHNSTYKIIQFINRNIIKVIADGISNSVLLLLKVMGEIPWIRATSTHRNPSSLSILILSLSYSVPGSSLSSCTVYWCRETWRKMLPVNLKISMKASHIDRHSNIPHCTY